MTPKQIEAELETLEPVRQQVRRQAMTYQYDAKQRVAARLGVPFEQVNLPFAEWRALAAQHGE